MLKTINLKAVIEQTGIDHTALAEALFPFNKYPKLALNRVIEGDGHLDAHQISRLSLLTGLGIEELYSTGSWKIAAKNKTMFFSNGEYFAELDMSGKVWTTKVFHKKSLFHEQILHTSDVVLGAYFEQLNNLILNHSENVKHQN
jgi:hypothetical protein